MLSKTSTLLVLFFVNKEKLVKAGHVYRGDFRAPSELTLLPRATCQSELNKVFKAKRNSVAESARQHEYSEIELHTDRDEQ